MIVTAITEFVYMCKFATTFGCKELDSSNPTLPI